MGYFLIWQHIYKFTELCLHIPCKRLLWNFEIDRCYWGNELCFHNYKHNANIFHFNRVTSTFNQGLFTDYCGINLHYHIVILPYCHTTILSYYHVIILPYCHTTILASGILTYLLSYFHIVNFHIVILSYCHTITLSVSNHKPHLSPQWVRSLWTAPCQMCSFQIQRSDKFDCQTMTRNNGPIF